MADDGTRWFIIGAIVGGVAAAFLVYLLVSKLNSKLKVTSFTRNEQGQITEIIEKEQ